MSLTIPLVNDRQHFDFQIELEGQTYTLELLWNTRALAWFVSFLTAEGLPIALNLRMSVDILLGKRIRGMPPGAFQLVDTTGARQDPGLGDLGARAQLYYFTAAELAELFT